jgi:hypothetical protein
MTGKPRQCAIECRLTGRASPWRRRSVLFARVSCSESSEGTPVAVHRIQPGTSIMPASWRAPATVPGQESSSRILNTWLAGRGILQAIQRLIGEAIGVAATTRVVRCRQTAWCGRSPHCRHGPSSDTTTLDRDAVDASQTFPHGNAGEHPRARTSAIHAQNFTRPFRHRRGS